MNKWKNNVMNPMIRKMVIKDPVLIYNADQTGLFYRKILNMIYFKEN